ncbi:MAG: hypothetical protein QF805_00985 [Pirellulaceae bacterium]|nr:hypothetical protein [Pirellulaceae bacterium]
MWTNSLPIVNPQAVELLTMMRFSIDFSRVGLFVMAVGFVANPRAAADELTPPTPPGLSIAGAPATIPRSANGVQSILTEIARTYLPHDYEDTRDWGGTKDVFAGIRLRREGWRIETKRRRKTVNHGTWKKYRVRLVEPDRNLKLRIENYKELATSKAAMNVVIAGRLDVNGRLSHWERGVQLISVSANADASVELWVGIEIGMDIDPTKIPPDVLLDVEVTAADLRLREFRLRNISNIDGPLAKRLSSGTREILEDQIARKRAKLVEKLNRKIDKNRDKLKLSLSDLIESPWKKYGERLIKPQPSGM